MTMTFVKDPDSVEWFYSVWCGSDGTNDGSVNDDGDLQGATISTSVWTVPTGVTKVTDNTNALTYHGNTYGVDTVAAIKLSGGTDATDYRLLNRVTTSDGRTLDHVINIRVRNNVT